jgi:PAS domain S-box-containing protein
MLFARPSDKKQESQMANAIIPTGREHSFGDEEVIVSKTDLKGHLTYVNDVFLRVSLYTEAELLGKPHNIIRHPEMPACVFQLLWDTIKKREEIFAYVLNMSKDGGQYWVFAHVTASYDLAGNHVGYHSNRRVPYSDALPAVKALYAKLSAEEDKYSSKKEGIQASTRMLHGLLNQQRKSYAQFVFGLSKFTSLQGEAA